MKRKLMNYGLKGLVLSLALVLLLMAGSAGTSAWLTAGVEPLENVFEEGKVPPEIVEEFNGKTKEHVQVKNTGNIDAYIRVALVAVWLDEDGDVAADAAPAPSFTHHANWFFEDGFWYHKVKVAPEGLTEDLIDEFEMPTRDGLTYELQVIASSIQADPKDAVEHAWPAVEVNSSGHLTPAGP